MRYIKADKTFDGYVQPKDGRQVSLEEMKKYVDGTIDMITLPSGRVMVINDEGALDGLPINEEATKIWLEEFPLDQYPHNNAGQIVGDVLIATANEVE